MEGTGQPGAHEDLTVAVIHYQTPELLRRCLPLVRTAAPKAKLLVIDTSERDPLEPADLDPALGARLIRQPNHSYAAAVNRGIVETTTSRFVQMNADVLVEPQTFHHLARAIDATGAAMAGPLPYTEGREPQNQGLPYRWHQRRARRRGITAVPWLSGCLQYLRTDAIGRVGGMDESLRFYNEDLEWCLRLRRAGEQCVLVDTPVVHIGGASTTTAVKPLVEGFRGGFQVTRRYYGPLATLAHRYAVLAYASLKSRTSRDEQEREAFAQIRRMFWRGNFDESPFGETLSS